MENWISIKERLPLSKESVWCRRYFIRNDGTIFSEITEATRESESPLIIHEDPSRYDFWKGDGNDRGRYWADCTVSHWMYKTPPEPPKEQDE